MNDQPKVVVANCKSQLLFFQEFDQVLGAGIGAVAIADELATVNVPFGRTVRAEIWNQNHINVFNFAETILEKLSHWAALCRWLTAVLKSNQESLVLVVFQTQREHSDRKDFAGALSVGVSCGSLSFPMFEKSFYVRDGRVPFFQPIHL